MFNYADFNMIKFNSKIEVPVIPEVFASTCDIGMTRKAFRLEKIVKKQ